jgi:hypothetical protein
MRRTDLEFSSRADAAPPLKSPVVVDEHAARSHNTTMARQRHATHFKYLEFLGGSLLLGERGSRRSAPTPEVEFRRAD